MSDIPHADLLADIMAFCAARDMAATRFGELAMGDTRFVSDLRNGRELRRKTLTKVQDWMTQQRASERKVS